MAEDLSQAQSLEAEPDPPQPDPAAPPDDDAEPDGVMQVGDKRLVDVSVVVAERKRARDAAERRVRDTELAPLQQKAQEADALRQALQAAQPYVDLVKQNQHLLHQQRQPQSGEDQVSDEEAEQEARELQLYGSDSQLDLRTAKRVIAKRRYEAHQISQQAVQAAIAPMQQQSADAASRSNFLAMAGQADAAGNPLVDPRILAEEWVKIPAELTQNREVAEVVLERAIGRTMRQGRGRSPQGTRQPVYSEASGGRQSGGPMVLSPLERKLGLSEKDLKESAKAFNPGGISVIGD